MVVLVVAAEPVERVAGAACLVSPSRRPVEPLVHAPEAVQAARILLGAQGTSVFGVYAGPVDTDMARELAMPKTSPRDVAFAILDGIEAGQEDIFPDPFAVEFGRRFQSSPKDSERQVAAMVAR